MSADDWKPCGSRSGRAEPLCSGGPPSRLSARAALACEPLLRRSKERIETYAALLGNWPLRDGNTNRGATDEAIASTAPLKRGQLLIFFARRRQKGEESRISALFLKTHTFSFRKPIINALVEFNPIAMNKRSACLALLALVCCANGEKDRRGRDGGDVKARRGAP